MKKILAVTLMLCIFTAMAVGTAAARPVSVLVSSDQAQCAEAVGLGAKVSASSIAGAAVCKTDSCFFTKTTVIGGAAQTATASACVGAAAINQYQETCVAIRA